ncbi:MAG: hypothetical protein CL483_09485 [Acidobacteria bacterium]|nr:hypothetical protein [Acidobacteriota bacterium]
MTDADAATGGLRVTTRDLVISTTQRAEVVGLTEQLTDAVLASTAEPEAGPCPLQLRAPVWRTMDGAASR